MGRMWGEGRGPSFRAGGHDRSATVAEMVPSSYADILRTSLYRPSERPVQFHGAEKGMPLRRWTAMLLVGLLATLLTAVILQLVLNR